MRSISKVKCQSCGQEVPPSAVNFQLSIYCCPNCKTTSRFRKKEEQKASSPGAINHSRQVRKEQFEVVVQPTLVEAPKGVTVEKEQGVLRIRARSFSAKSLLIAGFVVCWIVGVSLFAIYGILYDSSLALLVIPHGLVSLGLIYWAAFCLLNTTEIIASGNSLSVRSVPLPAIGAVSVPIDQIDQLFVCRENYITRDYQHLLYHLYAGRTDGRKTALLYGHETPHLALFVEQVLEKELGIQKLPVEGEVFPEELMAL